MSTDRSAWSPEEGDSLGNVDKEIQLVSTSSDSESISNRDRDKGMVKSDRVTSSVKSGTAPEGTKKKCGSNRPSETAAKSNVKLHSSCDDLCMKSDQNGPAEKKSSGGKNEQTTVTRSSTLSNLKFNIKTNSVNNGSGNESEKYDHIKSKVTCYFNNNNKVDNGRKPIKSSVISEIKEERKKEDYLEEINKQLTKELDEKNAILSLLQENYEHLLFKYAEAQNRIDELRFKCMTENVQDVKSPGGNCKYNKSDKSPPVLLFCNSECRSKTPDKCARAKGSSSNPFIKIDEPPSHGTDSGGDQQPATRPLSLPIDTNMKFVDRDLIMTKATTPTDSEGLSSIITSMSGHSKILNSLDEENQMSKKSNLLRCSTSNFILEEDSSMNDPFNKVKNWQNSLPPLEQIETPETALYNICSNSSEPCSSNETKYNDIPAPKLENDYVFIDEPCPLSWRDDHVQYCKAEKDSPLQAVPMPKRTVMGSVHNSKKSYNSGKGVKGNPENYSGDGSDGNKETNIDIPSTCIIQKRPKRPLLRCSSLPTYDHDSITSGNCKNSFYIPPLDLGNVTLSDEESYCQQDYNCSRSNASSYVTSFGDSVDRSIQMSHSFGSSKNDNEADGFYPRSQRRTYNKSTSITPDKSAGSDAFFETTGYNNRSVQPGHDDARYKSSRRLDSGDSTFRHGPLSGRRDWCNICGESIADDKPDDCFRHKSNSCESVNSSIVAGKQASVPANRTRSKLPFKRSMSFGSEARFCSHEKTRQNLENFDEYAKNLKARSQVVINALTAHINNS